MAIPVEIRGSRLENKEAFEERLGQLNFDRDTELNIMLAYDISKMSHNRQTRKSGERYFEHPRHVAISLIEMMGHKECTIKDPDLVTAGLLHDTGEDTALLGNLKDDPYTKWVETAEFRAGKIFGPKVAEMVVALTEPKIDREEFFSKEQAEKAYLRKLSQASPKTLLVKMADRLHNLRTLHAFSPEEQVRKIEETRGVYFPIFNRVLKDYPWEGTYLLRQIVQAIEELESALGVE